VILGWKRDCSKKLWVPSNCLWDWAKGCHNAIAYAGDLFKVSHCIFFLFTWLLLFFPFDITVWLIGLRFALSFRQYFLFTYFDMTFYKYVSCSKQTIGLYASFLYAKFLTLHDLLYGDHELSPTVVKQPKLWVVLSYSINIFYIILDRLIFDSGSGWKTINAFFENMKNYTWCNQ